MSLVWGSAGTARIFGRYGVSGLANIEISPEFAAKLGAAFGAAVGKRRTMITSRDHHKASRMINRALMAGLLSVGVDVQDLGVAPVPVVRYQIPALGLAGGAHVAEVPLRPGAARHQVLRRTAGSSARPTARSRSSASSSWRTSSAPPWTRRAP